MVIWKINLNKLQVFFVLLHVVYMYTWSKLRLNNKKINKEMWPIKGQSVSGLFTVVKVGHINPPHYLRVE